MPNWVNHEMLIIGNQDRVDECIKFLSNKITDEEETYYTAFDFNKVIPQPKEFDDTRSPNDNREQAKELLEKYGAEDWYVWRRKNWNTKWNAHCAVNDGNIIEFETAWNTPRNVIKKLSTMYPDLSFEVIYADEDWGVNYGAYTFVNGEYTFDEIYSVDNGDPDEIISRLWSGYDEWKAEQAQKEPVD